MRVIFAGTPKFAVPSLDALIHSGYHIAAVLTQPDRPAGRGRRITVSPVKQLASAHGLPVHQPPTLRNGPAPELLRELSADVMIVVAYGLILPGAVLRAPARGCVNVHASLLPRWRGAAPIPRAIEAGDAYTGVTLMQMDQGLDTGPVLATAQTAIGEIETAQTLHDRLARMGAELLVKQLPAYLEGSLRPVPQDDAHATRAPKLTKEEAPIDWTLPAARLARKINAFNPWPVAHTWHHGERLRVWLAQPTAGETTAAAGTVVAVSGEGVDVACGDGVVRLLSLQREGGRPMASAEFVRGHPLLTGERLLDHPRSA